MLMDEWTKEEYLEYRREELLEEAREKGEEIGQEKEKLIIARNLLEKGSTPEFVHEITGLSPEEIEEIDI